MAINEETCTPMLEKEATKRRARLCPEESCLFEKVKHKLKSFHESKE